jgi:sulfide:quinone oxidoreductase
MSRTHVVIAGAGVAALEGALALRSLAEERVSVELIAPEPEFVYRPLAVAEPFRIGDVRRFPLRTFVDAVGADLREDSIVAVEPGDRRITLASGGGIGYDVLFAALGAVAEDAVVGATTFRGSGDGGELGRIVERAVNGSIRRVVFAVPAAAAWTLPAYELALMTREFLSEHGTAGVEIVLATPEDRPLGLFGPVASEAISELLALREVELLSGVAARAWQDGVLVTSDASIDADAVVALPALVGPRLAGLAHDSRGFVPTDEFGWVLGTSDVYAAGDMTQFPIKQGGLATQQADAAASAIAADAGAQVQPAPFRPILRGLLMTGTVPRYMRNEPGRGTSEIDTEPLWWPPAKIVGRHLAPFLASRFRVPEAVPPAWGALEVEVELDRYGAVQTHV